MIDIPNDTLICTDEEKHKDDKLCLEVFLEGYGYNFLSESNLQFYILLIAYGRLHTLFAKNYKKVIRTILQWKLGNP